MKKQHIVMLSSAIAAFVLTACGGGGGGGYNGSSSSSVASSYKTVYDLAYKKLNLTERWQITNEITSSNYLFEANIQPTSDGDVILDSRVSSASASIIGCMEDPVGFGTYSCMFMFDSGGVAIHVITINKNGSINGNFEYSSTGNVDELANVYTDYCDAYVSGYVSSNSQAAARSLEQEKISDEKFYSAKQRQKVLKERAATLSNADVYTASVKTVLETLTANKSK